MYNMMLFWIYFFFCSYMRQKNNVCVGGNASTHKLNSRFVDFVDFFFFICTGSFYSDQIV